MENMNKVMDTSKSMGNFPLSYKYVQSIPCIASWNHPLTLPILVTLILILIQFNLILFVRDTAARHPQN